tara:strand:- start:128 stop:331 length:204 start_codon:yes stop_codon:yes gene_type:complete
MDNFEKTVIEYINNEIKKKCTSKAMLYDLPTTLQLRKKCYKKFGRWGADIAKVHLQKTMETNMRELI